MSEQARRGRVTIPTDVDVVPETLELLKRWGADAIRDCDGTDYPDALKGVDAKVYSTYYTTRKDNAWAEENPDEVQQCYIMTGFHTAGAIRFSFPVSSAFSFFMASRSSASRSCGESFSRRFSSARRASSASFASFTAFSISAASSAWV